MITALLPDGVVAVEAYGDEAETPETPAGADLFPEEAALVARAVPRRRREFVTARRCARRALAGLGVPPVAIPSGPRREPVWPEGIVGSITHCAGYRAAVVARAVTVASVGIDAEPHAPLPEGVHDTIVVGDEARALAELGDARPEICWGRLLFCAKEAVYKTWYPLTRRWLGFRDAEITFSPPEYTEGGPAAVGAFTARLLVDGTRVDGGPPLAGFSGRWLVDRGLAVTAIAVPPVAGT